MAEYANVKYFGCEKVYKYAVPTELEGKVNQGDFVVVNVPDGNCVARVQRISNTVPKFKCKPVLRVIDLS